ncbi:MAG: Eco57I restriction-modification methylase domain-containing protein [Myxococcales bacterium]|nr:Eco57I restriction-modification methylase domain-containing protein [Myxococcales bacterium]
MKMNEPSFLMLEDVHNVTQFAACMRQGGWEVVPERACDAGAGGYSAARWMERQGYAGTLWGLSGVDSSGIWFWDTSDSVRPQSESASQQLVEYLAESAATGMAMLVTWHGGLRREMEIHTVISGIGTRCWRGAAGNRTLARDEVFEVFTRTHEPELLIVELSEILSRQEVGRRFFADVRKNIQMLDIAWQNLRDDRSESRRYLSLLLLCRLMFLYFVQRKGWLARDERFLARWLLHRDAQSPWGQGDIYTHILRPIFFEILNRADRSGRTEPAFSGVPFLNGGLFSPAEVELQNPDAQISDEALRKLIAQVFERYRFVESERAGREAAVNPAMLGRVFEELMMTPDRESAGAYYTPPTLVDRMVRETLQDALGASPDIPVSSEATQRADLLELYQRACAIRVLDCACGSGAFLLGMLDALTDLRVTLLQRLGKPASRYDERRDALTSCIYGIDRSPIAIMLCELRLWLSLANDLPDGAAPEPLPNLGQRIRCGDALLSPHDVWMQDGIAPDADLAHQQRYLTLALARANGDAKSRLSSALSEVETELARTMLERVMQQRSEELQRLTAPGVDLFGEPSSVSNANAAQIRAAQRSWEEAYNRLQQSQAQGWTPPFHPTLHFAGVMAEGGFDVVIGNPPWIRLSDLPGEQRRSLLSRYRWMSGAGMGEVFGRQPDVAVAFVERGLELLREGGVLSYLLPSKLFSAGYAARLRQEIRTHHTLLALADLTGSPDARFDADVFPGVMRVRKGRSSGEIPLVSVQPVGQRTVQVPDSLIAPFSHDARQGWALFDAGVLGVLQQLARLPNLQLAGILPALGLKTGLNEAFRTQRNLASECLPLVTGGSVRAMSWQADGHLLFTHDLQTARPLTQLSPEALQHLQVYQGALERRVDLRAGDPWWRLFRVDERALGWRVVWRDLAPQLQATWLPPLSQGGPLALNSTYLIAVRDRRQAIRLAAWLNTTLARFVAVSSSEHALGGYRRFGAAHMQRIPWPSGFSDERETVMVGRFQELAEHWADHPEDESAYESLDALSARLVGLTGSQWAILRRAAASVSAGRHPLSLSCSTASLGAELSTGALSVTRAGT